jgi:hypothetical protein
MSISETSLPPHIHQLHAGLKHPLPASSERESISPYKQLSLSPLHSSQRVELVPYAFVQRRSTFLQISHTLHDNLLVTVSPELVQMLIAN